MTTPETPRPHTSLHRSRTDRRIAGVCGGLAETLGVDATLLRVVVVLLAVFGHLAGLVFYLAFWALVPEAEQAPEATI